MTEGGDDAGAGARTAFLNDVLDGLSKDHKMLSPKYFYDTAGSELFEAICRTPEYYPTRVETAILARICPEISEQIAPGAVLVEFGSGASDKTRILLDAAPQIRAYMPIDISAGALAPAAARIVQAYPGLEVLPVQADFTRPVLRPELAGAGMTVGFFPGSTIGNFTPDEARRFLIDARTMLGPTSLFVIGADLVKNETVLIQAYDDAGGVTAAFNLNLLTRMNRELGADFDLTGFRHRVIWNAGALRIEMHLESIRPQTVHIEGQTFKFRRNETIHTENSYKFTLDGFEHLARLGGWVIATQSSDRSFAVFVLSPLQT